jgi:hypothetical protein
MTKLKSRAVIITDLLQLQMLAMEKTIYHEQEAARYRRTFGQITNRIMQMRRLNRKGKI